MKESSVVVNGIYTEKKIRYNFDMSKKPQKEVKVTGIYTSFGRKKVKFEVLNWGETGSRRKGTMFLKAFCESYS